MLGWESGWELGVPALPDWPFNPEIKSPPDLLTMCGRYALFGPISRHRDNEELLFTFLDRNVAFVPHYNAAPTQYLPVYRMALGQPHGFHMSITAKRTPWVFFSPSHW